MRERFAATRIATAVAIASVVVAGACHSSTRPGEAPTPSAVATAARLANADANLRPMLAPREHPWSRREDTLLSPTWHKGAPLSVLAERLPMTADGTIEVARGGLASLGLTMTAVGARAVEAQDHAGRVLYENAYPSTDVLAVATPQRFELLMLLHDEQAPRTFTWRVALPSGLTARTEPRGGLVLSDPKGDPMLRVPRPFAVDARGEHRDAELAWNGEELSVRLDTRALQFPVLLDPAVETSYWVERTPLIRPPARQRHGMAYDRVRARTTVFGGRLEKISPPLGDTWEWDGTDWLTTTPPSSPSARYWHAMAYDTARGNTVLFGGTDGTTDHADTWSWNGTTWTQLAPATSPPARHGHAMVYDAARGVIVLFGGANTTDLNDTWTWNGTTWTQQTPATSPPVNGVPRMAYDSKHAKTYVFSGWEWDGTTWSASPYPPPVAAGSFPIAYDESREVMVFFDFTNNLGSLTLEWDGESDWKTALTDVGGGDSPSEYWGNAMVYEDARLQLMLFGGSGGFNLIADDSMWTYAAHGGSCTNDTQCASHSCVDGVCCDSVCGTCQACNLAGLDRTPGICSPVRDTQDPDTCTGINACDLEGRCRRALAKPCTAHSDCLSDACADGLCCESRCLSQCEACDVAGSEGSCVAVPKTPHGARNKCEKGEGACATRECDGIARESCEGYLGPETACRKSECVNGVATFAASCDGKGACPPVQTAACAPYTCDVDSCKTICNRDDDCAAQSHCDVTTHVCIAGATCDGDHTTVSADGKQTTDCFPYRCEENGTCKEACGSVADCAAPTVCDRGHVCVPPQIATAARSGCSMSRGADGPDATVWLLGLLPLLAASARRRAFWKKS